MSNLGYCCFIVHIISTYSVYFQVILIWSRYCKHLNSPGSGHLLWQYVRIIWLQRAIKHVFWKVRHIRDSQVEIRAQHHFVSPHEAWRIRRGYFSKLIQALLSNWARSLCLKTAADVSIGNLLSDIRVLTVYAPHFLFLLFYSAFQKKDHIHPDLASSSHGSLCPESHLKASPPVYKHTALPVVYVFTFSASSNQSHSPYVSALHHFSLSKTISHNILSFLDSISSLSLP